jgi:hypothetical protein
MRKRSMGEWFMAMIGRNRLAGAARTVQQENDAHVFFDEGARAIRELVREIAALREAVWAIQKLQTERDVRLNQELKDYIMAAIDNLKTDLANLIAEATADITALLAKINSQSNQDPAIVALSDQAKAATQTLHDAFTNATNVVPPTVNPPTAVDPSTGQPLPPASAVTPTPAPASPAPATSAGIDPATGQPLPPGA